jgi:hypothetical protein
MQTKTPRELRKFGLVVGGVFGVLAAISWWRGHQIPPAVMGTLCVLLMVPGALFPTVLRPVESGWMRMAAVLGHVNSRIILTLAYYAILTPTGIIRRLIKDPLNRRLGERNTSEWIRREREPVDLARYQQQF